MAQQCVKYIHTMKEFLELVETKLRDLDTEINKLQVMEIRDTFSIGSTTIYTNGISDSQALYAVSVMKSRLTASKLLKGRPDVTSNCEIDLAEFLGSIEHYDKLRLLRDDKSEYLALKMEATKLLSDDEKRAIFKEKSDALLDAIDKRILPF